MQAQMSNMNIANMMPAPAHQQQQQLQQQQASSGVLGGVGLVGGVSPASNTTLSMNLWQ